MPDGESLARAFQVSRLSGAGEGAQPRRTARLFAVGLSPPYYRIQAVAVSWRGDSCRKIGDVKLFGRTEVATPYLAKPGLCQRLVSLVSPAACQGLSRSELSDEVIENIDPVALLEPMWPQKEAVKFLVAFEYIRRQRSPGMNMFRIAMGVDGAVGHYVKRGSDDFNAVVKQRLPQVRETCRGLRHGDLPLYSCRS